MKKPIQAPDARTEPGHGWCHWHNGTSGTAVLISVIESTSGPGYAKYACQPCREQRNLVPFGQA